MQRTHEQIIKDAGGHKGLAAQLGLPARRVMFWERRKSIPAAAWITVAEKKIAPLAELAQRRK